MKHASFAVYVATFVATSVIGVAMLSRVVPGASPAASTSEKLGLAWIEGATFCGSYPSAEKVASATALSAAAAGQAMSQGCAGAKKSVISKEKHVDADSCAAWCPTAAPGGVQDWCCSFTEAGSGKGAKAAATCTVSDGVATMVPSTSAAKTQAFSSCGPAAGSLGVVKGTTPYECPTEGDKKMQDAMNFGIDNKSEDCSQLCLPKAYWGATPVASARAPSRANPPARPPARSRA